MLETLTEILESVGLNPFHLFIIGGLAIFFLAFYMNEQLLSNQNQLENKAEVPKDD